MSTNTKTVETTDRSSLTRARYARRDWWGGDTDDDSEDSETIVGHDPAGNRVTKQKIETLAHRFLKQTLDRPMLDPIALFEDTSEGMHPHEGMAVDLTDPELYPPRADSLETPRRKMERKAPSTKKWRYSREYGHISYGGIVPDRSTEELLADLPVFFDIVAVDVHERVRGEITEEVAKKKADGELHDTQIMRNVARWVFDPNQIGNWVE